MSDLATLTTDNDMRVKASDRCRVIRFRKHFNPTSVRHLELFGMKNTSIRIKTQLELLEKSRSSSVERFSTLAEIQKLCY